MKSNPLPRFCALAIVAILTGANSVKASDPRAVHFELEYKPKNHDTATDTRKSIVIVGARDDTGIYRIEGIKRGFTVDELGAVLRLFYTDFPKDAKTVSEGMKGLPVPRPNILYKSLSWAETKDAGRKLALSIAKDKQVSLYYYVTNPNFKIVRVRDEKKQPDYSTAIIDYYDQRMHKVIGKLPSNK